jgi:hypothetical protein
VNLAQRIALSVALAVGLWGLSQALVPFDVTSPFGLSSGCSSPLVALSDDEPAVPEDFLGEVDEDDLETCADVAGRRIVSAVVVMVLAAVGGYGASRLLADGDAVEDRFAADEGPVPEGSPSRPGGDGGAPLGDELPPYAG